MAGLLALGFGLTDLKNSITKTTMACFEPALDYIVVKIPRWDLKKFKHVSTRIGSGMKSVGEVMAIGRTFEEALQKGLRMLEIGASGLVLNKGMEFDDVHEVLTEPTDLRIFAIPEAIKAGFSVEAIHDRTYIDRWFLHKIENIVDIENRLNATGEQRCPRDLLLEAKQHGFSDEQIGRALEITEDETRELRRNYGLTPCVKQIDTLAAEYPAQTNYLYLTYNGVENDLSFLDRPEILKIAFHPRKSSIKPSRSNAKNHFIEVEKGIKIGCRFHTKGFDHPSLLIFHGDGATVNDYDPFAPIFNEIGINLFVADYRGYGFSDGRPTMTNMVKDSHQIFERFHSKQNHQL